MRYLMSEFPVEFLGFSKDQIIEDSDTYEFVEIDANGVETVTQYPRSEVPEEVLRRLDIKKAEMKRAILEEYNEEVQARRIADLVNTDYFD